MMPSIETRYLLGPFTVDLSARTITHDGVPLKLAWRHFEALKLLVEAGQRVVPKEQFFQRLWPDAQVVDESNLTQCISQLRKALANGNGRTFVETVPRVGYRLVVSPTAIEASSSSESAPAVVAATQIDRALQSQPYEVGWHVIRATILYLDRRYDDSLAASDRGLTITEAERGPWEWRSKALFQLGRGEEAIKALAEVAFAEHSLRLDAAVRDGGRNAGLKTLLDITGDWRSHREQAWRRAPWRALLDDSEGAFSELETD